MKYTLYQLIIKLKKYFIIKKSFKLNMKREKIQINNGSLHLIYRISDAGYPKVKPDYISNNSCLENALKAFPYHDCDWTIIADNCSKETINMIDGLLEKYGFDKKIVKIVSIGSGAGTFNLAMRIAKSFDDNDIVYFLENDYIHKELALPALKSAFEFKRKIDYVTLYDHPYHYSDDFIMSSFNMKSFVLCNDYGYWKKSPSTTMTFACKISTLKKDYRIFNRWTSKKHAFDIEIFIELARKKRILISPIPGYSTHGETEYLSKFVNWERYVNGE